MKNGHNFHPDKELAPNKHQQWKNPYTNCQHNCRRYRETKSISGRVRIAILVLSGARKGESSTLVWWKAWWWFQWLDCRSLLCGFSSKVLGKVCLFAFLLCYAFHFIPYSSFLIPHSSQGLIVLCLNFTNLNYTNRLRVMNELYHKYICFFFFSFLVSYHIQFTHQMLACISTSWV